MKRILSLTLAVLLLTFSLSLYSCSEDDGGNYLHVGMECAYAPYNWTQTTNEHGAVEIADSNNFAYGYDVIIAKLLAEDMGYDGVIVHRIDWESLPLALQSGLVDCVIAGQSITADRMAQVDFTTPYYYASIVTLVKNDSPYANATSIAELSGAKAISQINTVWYDTCIPQIPNVDKLTAAETAGAMIVNLTSGNCDIVVTDLPTAQAASYVNSDLKILDFTGTDGNFEVSEEEINIGISVKKGNSELLTSLNAALAKLTTADFDKYMQDAIKVQPLSE